jgi:hypothetical protein
MKICLLLSTAAVMSYCSVSPRVLPLPEYNLRFYENTRLLSLSCVGPIIMLISVFDAKYVHDINSIVHTFFMAATVGYVLTYAAESIASSIIRLVVYKWIEPRVFEDLLLKLPVVAIPWVIHDNRYKPNKIALFVANVVCSGVSAAIEEYAKLLLLSRTVELPK